MTVNSVLNYEQLTTTNFYVNVTAFDGYVNSESRIVQICVNDENEQPEFTETTWTITKNDEGGVKSLTLYHTIPTFNNPEGKTF